jgi:sulfur-oxidizing protein SoxX
MPSYAHLSENERRLLARYMASLRVQDWYLEETRKAEHEKLTGEERRP